MQTTTRRIIVVFVAASVLMITVIAPLCGIPIVRDLGFSTWLGGDWLLDTVDRLIPPGEPGQNLNTNDREVYLSFAVIGIGLATSLSILFWLLEPSPDKEEHRHYVLCLLDRADVSVGEFRDR